MIKFKNKSMNWNVKKSKIKNLKKNHFIKMNNPLNEINLTRMITNFKNWINFKNILIYRIT